jgi:hypothetical protein
MVVEKTIQKIPVLPFALMLGCIGAVIGIIVGIFYAVVFGALFSAFLSNIPASTGYMPNSGIFGLFFGLAAVVIMPITMFVGGLIQGALIAFVYNFLAPRIGGIKLQFKEDSPTGTF